MKKKSIVTSYMSVSAISGEPAENVHHLIFGGSMRKLADEDGLTIPVTAWEHTAGPVTQRIHDNSMAESLSKILGEIAWEKEFYRRQCTKDDEDPARDAFRRRYGKNFV